jgi:hypothetical protein
MVSEISDLGQIGRRKKRIFEAGNGRKVARIQAAAAKDCS